jgi:hypothetical protein
LERRLTEVGERLKQLREELVVTDEQLAALADAADDAPSEHSSPRRPLPIRSTTRPRSTPTP